MGYYVYKHICPNRKAYIGITKRNPLYRWNNGNGYYNQVFYKAIKKYGWDNIKHLILYRDLEEDVAKAKEIELIQKYKTNQRNYGYNITKGGDSLNGITHTLETKQKMRDAHLGNKSYWFGKFGKYNPESKPVAQYTMDNIFIRNWECATQASKELNINQSNISNCCRGRKKSAGGYIWKYI